MNHLIPFHYGKLSSSSIDAKIGVYTMCTLLCAILTYSIEEMAYSSIILPNTLNIQAQLRVDVNLMEFNLINWHKKCVRVCSSLPGMRNLIISVKTVARSSRTD